MSQSTPTTDAASLLIDAANTITERGKQRDKPNGERSMGRCVRAFNAIYGTTLTEEQGWQFMALLKIARSATGRVLHMDDFIDQTAYGALAGECAARIRPTEVEVHCAPTIGYGQHQVTPERAAQLVTAHREKVGNAL